MNDLGLNLDDLDPAPRGETRVVVARELSLGDLAALDGLKGAEPPTIKRVSERHHALARAIASGMKDGEAARITGYQQSHVSILKRSPAFLELIELYRDDLDAEFSDFAARLAGLGLDALHELQTRLEDEPEKFTIGQLTELSIRLADRAGHGPVQRTENLNVSMSLGEKMALARARAERARDITPPE